MAMSSRTPITMASRSPAPSSSQARPQVPTNVTPEGVLGEILFHKSYLNNYCQKLHLPLPIYQTEVDQSGVYPRFKSTVQVRNGTFRSENTFANRASAEHDAAKLALKHLLAEAAKSTEDKARYTNPNLRQLVCLSEGQWKAMINEFIHKMKTQCSYETAQVDQRLPPLFVSCLILNGNRYKPETGSTKKEAEQLAARAAILSLLDDPTFATPISQVIKAKVKVDAAFCEANNIPSTRVTGNELNITGNAAFNSGENANVKPLNPIFRWYYVNPVPITPALNLADVPSSSRKRQLGRKEKEANKKLCAYYYAKNK